VSFLTWEPNGDGGWISQPDSYNCGTNWKGSWVRPRAAPDVRRGKENIPSLASRISVISCYAE
jgi:hypothetical protein